MTLPKLNGPRHMRTNSHARPTKQSFENPHARLLPCIGAVYYSQHYIKRECRASREFAHSESSRDGVYVLLNLQTTKVQSWVHQFPCSCLAVAVLTRVRTCIHTRTTRARAHNFEKMIKRQVYQREELPQALMPLCGGLGGRACLPFNTRSRDLDQCQHRN